MSDSAPLASEKEPWNTKSKEKFETKSKSEFYDPCQEAAQRSYKWRIGTARLLGYVRVLDESTDLLRNGAIKDAELMSSRLSGERKNEGASWDDLAMDDIWM
ncbi:uncharacterized protein MAM_06123 [Metarhizium album ARSEF 1941]|uniref:Uncharacterized protein n=1 Tax=Metarhizium album (strain ARSEF 1941) TaxID=1081103 RepID=A0A0B2WPS4_METAS|nr:uncharacterized protein MAM_06123 [Metarhizium album ARSEF 1941]KHN96018.1 hypothetical protein MAM_06123 [Metarhizium album ARSEF 1941]